VVACGGSLEGCGAVGGKCGEAGEKGEVGEGEGSEREGVVRSVKYSARGRGSK